MGSPSQSPHTPDDQPLTGRANLLIGHVAGLLFLLRVRMLAISAFPKSGFRRVLTPWRSEPSLTVSVVQCPSVLVQAPRSLPFSSSVFYLTRRALPSKAEPAEVRWPWLVGNSRRMLWVPHLAFASPDKEKPSPREGKLSLNKSSCLRTSLLTLSRDHSVRSQPCSCPAAQDAGWKAHLCAA